MTCLVYPSTPTEATGIVTPYRTLVHETQELHGCSYDFPGADIAVAGFEVPLFSPINGEVTGMGIDEWNNTYIVIENGQYRVALLHGVYDKYIGVGDQVVRGITQIGHQASIGYSTGPHSHFTVWDKRAGGWIDPLGVMSLTPPSAN